MDRTKRQGSSSRVVRRQIIVREEYGYEVVTDVLSRQEREDIANNYKRAAGFQVEALNTKPGIVPRLG